MPYLGNIPPTQYAELKYQDFTGGTGTSFTLNDPVGSAQELEVFVNNVRQEPGVAYTANGTALTMTGSIVATDDFYVVFQGKAIGTATHPAGQALTATDGTFTGNLDVSNGNIKLDGNYPTGTSNVAIGDAALDDGSLSGGYNTAAGAGALSANTSGAQNTAVGAFSSDANTTGSYNSGFGQSSLGSNTTGDNNTGLGRGALSANTTASNNTAAGYNALAANTTGTGNTAVGKGALDANTTASNNTAVGLGALGANTSGASNTAVGNSCAESQTTASNNTIIGQNAGRATTTGSQNVFIGTEAADDNTTGQYNCYVGYQSGDKSTVSSANTFIGNNAGGNFNGSASNTFNTFIGCDAGQTITTGVKNTILGAYNGNQHGIDIRTVDNHIVISDGSGYPAINTFVHQDVKASFDISRNDTSQSTNTITVSQGSTVNLFGGGNNFSGMFIINEIQASGGTGIFLTGGGGINRIGETGNVFFATDSPSSGQYGLFKHTDNSIRLKTGSSTGTTRFRIMSFRTRATQ